jgi:hypothetical protein
MTKKKTNHAVSEVLSTALLLGMTIALFGFLNFIVFSFSFEQPAPSVNLIGSIENTQNNITIDHEGGESLVGNTKIIITIGSNTSQSTISDIITGVPGWNLTRLTEDKNPDKWDFGEMIKFHSGYYLTDTFVQASVMDPSTNTLLLSVVLQQGPSTTSELPNRSPTISSPLPTNGSSENLLSFTWSVQITDPEGDPFIWTIQCSNGQTNNGVGPNGRKTIILSGLAYSIGYRVWVNATDPTGSNLYTRKWYTFTTKPSNSPPVFGTPSPDNNSMEAPLSFSWNIPINDLEGNTFSWTIQCNGQSNSGSGAINGTKSLTLFGLTSSTTYKVWVNATDPTGSGLYTRRWYAFTTQTTAMVNLKPNQVYDNTSGSEYTLTSSDRLNLNISDNLKYQSQGSWPSSYSERIECNFPDIPASAIVTNVTLKFEWSITGTSGTTTAQLRIFDGSSWQIIPLILSTSDVIVTRYLYDSGIINTASKVNALKIWLQINTNKNNYYTWIDWVQVDVTYTA